MMTRTERILNPIRFFIFCIKPIITAYFILRLTTMLFPWYFYCCISSFLLPKPKKGEGQESEDSLATAY